MEKIISSVRQACPLAHHITNNVTINDCANATIAIGGSAAMADYIDEMKDFARIGSSLVLNTGTLNEMIIESMLEACKHYGALNKAIVLDPVALGVSAARDRLNYKILDSSKLSIIKGNASEIACVVGLDGKARGVDSTISVSDEFIEKGVKYARERDVVLAVTGAVDYVIGANKVARIYNGSPMASKITGAGCMCASVCGVFAGVYESFNAAVWALASFGIASKQAEEISSGTGSFRANLLDKLSALDDEIFAKHANYKVESI